jgi:hypothetical protein
VPGDSSPLVVNLPDAAEPAWRAYCAMLASKDAHFGFLAELDKKVKDGGQRTLAEAARLQQLLAEHNDCVKTFATVVKTLAVEQPAAHAAFVTALASLNQAMGAAVN